VITRPDPICGFDLNGNLATFTDVSGTTTYTWNARNQLTAISGPGLTGSFTYDSFGRRTGKTINATTTNFVYDGLNPVQEKNGATVTANLLTGLGIDEFFTRTDGVGVRSLLPDVLGSTVALGDGTGTLQTQYTYEPFGLASQTGSASTSSYKFTGREDDGTGLMYYRARYYHSRPQRFIAEDPIGLQGGINFYAYVYNNPLGFADALGLLPIGPPPVPVPGDPNNGWRWNPNPQNSRGGSWGPQNPIQGQSQPSGSWDPGGHWDIDNGKGSRQRYNQNGAPISADEAHGRRPIRPIPVPPGIVPICPQPFIIPNVPMLEEIMKALHSTAGPTS
jgi:RHS repeat-associated protein